MGDWLAEVVGVGLAVLALRVVEQRSFARRVGLNDTPSGVGKTHRAPPDVEGTLWLHFTERRAAGVEFVCRVVRIPRRDSSVGRARPW